MRVQAENFQCFASLDIHLSGFTAIVGPTNNGKSALTRVLRTALYNDWHPSFIREGTKRTSVEVTDFVETPNGISQISLAKASSVNSFQITSALGTETYPKVGTGVPEDITNAGFSLFETDKGDHNLNFQTQFDKLFLLTEGYTAFTSFFNSLFKIDRYETALQFLTSDQTRKRSEHSKLAEEEGPLFKKTEELSDLYNALNNAYSSLQTLVQEQAAAHENATQASELSENIQRAANSLRIAKAETAEAFSFKTKVEDTLGRVEKVLSLVPFNMGSITVISAHQQDTLIQANYLVKANRTKSLLDNTIPRLEEALLAANLKESKIKLEAQLSDERAGIQLAETSLDNIHHWLKGFETTTTLRYLLRDLEAIALDNSNNLRTLAFLQMANNLAEAILLSSEQVNDLVLMIDRVETHNRFYTRSLSNIEDLQDLYKSVSSFIQACETELATLTTACPHCHTPLSDEDITKICQHHSAIK